MREIAAELAEWAASGETFAVATVIAVRGSTPREPGAAMALRSDGQVIGSISGGCVESSVYELAREVLRTEVPVRTVFGDDPDPFAVGMTCGGELEVLVQPVSRDLEPGLTAAFAAVRDGRAVTIARVTTTADDSFGRTIAILPDGPAGDSGSTVDSAIVEHGTALLERGGTARRLFAADGSCRPSGDIEVLFESWATRPTMLVFGAIDFAAALTEMGRFLGYHVVLCDARATFTTRDRFPAAHEVVVDWPHRYLASAPTDHRTLVCVLTHDARFDIPLLTEALRRPLGYVGALGSRRTHAQRLHGLRAAGLVDAEIARLRSPIGLDLGGRTPEETAVSIAAEVVAAARGGSCLPLSTSDGPIHQDQPARISA